MSLFRRKPRARSSIRPVAPQVESLESRLLLHAGGDAPSILFSGGVLTIMGTHHANVIDVSKVFSKPDKIVVTIDGQPDPSNPNGYDPNAVDRIEVHGLQGNDTINIAGTINQPTSLFGDEGNDTINGGGGDDTIDGGTGKDSLMGNASDDVLNGGTSNDALSGGAGGDILSGGTGKDSLSGGDDDDILVSDSKDSQTGGNGSDLFGPAKKPTQRTDFAAGTDFDAGASVTVGDFMDSVLAGSRQDTLPGAPDVNDRHHTNGDVDYVGLGFSNPPTYGPHHPFDLLGTDVNPGITPRPTGIYDTEQPDEDIVHNLEHGHVSITYNPLLISAADLAKLKAVVNAFGGGGNGVILSPRAADLVAIDLVSWAHLQSLAGFDLGAVSNFIIQNRGHSPEGYITP